MMDYQGDDDYDDLDVSPYQNGYWIWCTEKNALVYKHYVTEDNTYLLPVTTCGATQFRDDMDTLQQARYQKFVQRKSEGDDDVILLQDVKDLVLYTAPQQLLSFRIICIFHLPITERFLRALILYCQYYMQTDELMAQRSLEAETTIPTENTKEIEVEIQRNLQDLRLLLFKEYAEFITGSGEVRKYHHQGHHKQSKSLNKIDGILFETLIMLSIQMVWIALGRQWYNQIDHEVHRLFKSDRYNVAEHRQSYKQWCSKETPREQDVLRGDSLKRDGKLNAHSALFHEFCSNRDIDYRIFGIGSVKYKTLDERLRYLEAVLTTPESLFLYNNITLGIIGLKRKNFDIILKPLVWDTRPSDDSSKLSRLQHKASRSMTASSTRTSCSSRKLSSTSGRGKGGEKRKIFPNIYLPEKYENGMPMDETFSTEHQKQISICVTQRRKWILRYQQFARRQASSKNPSIL